MVGCAISEVADIGGVSSNWTVCMHADKAHSCRPPCRAALRLPLAAGVAIGAKAATVAGGCSLVALWMLGVLWMLVCYGSMGICTKRGMASGLKEVSVGGAEVQSLPQFSCRGVHADRIAERVGQLALSGAKQSQMELWYVRQQRLWASGVSGRHE